jgi:adenylylsulfate kinase
MPRTLLQLMASAPEDNQAAPGQTSSPDDRKKRLGQQARVIWLYGLSGAGKSTLATGLALRLEQEGFITQVLDGDVLRAGLNRDLGFSDADRAENIRRVAEVSRLFVQAGVVVINAFITPMRAHREMARQIVGPADFIEVHVDASWEICSRRDLKGLYARARSGGLGQFTGRDSPFEPPERAELVLQTDRESAAQSLKRLHAFVYPKLRPWASSPPPCAGSPGGVPEA